MIAAALAAPRPTATRRPPGRRRAPPRRASTSSQSRFLRPAETWLTTTEPSAPPSVSNCTTRRPRSSTGRGSARRRRRGRTRAPVARARAPGTAVSVRADSARDAVAGDELGQVAPVRPDVGERARGAAELRVDAPVVVSAREQPVLQVGAVDAGARRRSSAGAIARAGLAHRRVVAVDERHGGHAAASRRPRARAARAPPASRASGFSQTTCLPASSAARASGTCRWFGVQTWTTSTSVGGDQLLGASSKAALRAEPPRPPRRCARASRRATPATRAAGERAPSGRARAPMNPAPTIRATAERGCRVAHATRTSPTYAGCQAEVCVV